MWRMDLSLIGQDPHSKIPDPRQREARSECVLSEIWGLKGRRLRWRGRTLEDKKGISLFARWESISFCSHSLGNFLNKYYIAPSCLLRYIYQPGLNSCYHQPQIDQSFAFSLALTASSRGLFTALSGSIKAISKAGLKLQCLAKEGKESSTCSQKG